MIATYSEDTDCSYALDEPSFDESISDLGEIRKYKRTTSEESMLVLLPEKDHKAARSNATEDQVDELEENNFLIGMILFSL